MALKRTRKESDATTPSSPKSRHRMTTRSQRSLKSTVALHDVTNQPLRFVIDPNGLLGTGCNGAVFKAKRVGDERKGEEAFVYAVKIYPWGDNTREPVPDELAITALAGVYGIGPFVHQITVVKDILKHTCDCCDDHVSELEYMFRFSVITHSTFVCMVMDRIPDAKPFSNPTIRNKKRMTRSVAERWASFDSQLDEKLAFLNKAKIAHRDLKCCNALTSSDGQMYIVDWGEAVLK